MLGAFNGVSCACWFYVIVMARATHNVVVCITSAESIASLVFMSWVLVITA